jgi:predicted kinase
MGVPLLVVDCQVPHSLLEQRVTLRQRHGQDASEADLSVLRRQLAASEPLLPAEGLECFVADTSAEDVITRAVSAVRARRLVVPRLADPDPQAGTPGFTRLSA